jgi:hypothetical protein
MKYKINHEVLEEKLKLGEVIFEYNKKDGILRQAKGTSKTEMIPEGLRPKGGVKATRGTPYFDLELNEWRSITADSQINVDLKSLMELPGMPILSDEEVQFILWDSNNLEDEWLDRFIDLAYDATPQDAVEFLNTKFKNLVRVVRKFKDEEGYSKEINDKWNKLVN